MDMEERRTRFRDAILAKATKAILEAVGERNNTLNAQAFNLGRWAATGVIAQEAAQAALEQAADRLFAFDEHEERRKAQQTVVRALRDGARRPLTWPKDLGGNGIPFRPSTRALSSPLDEAGPPRRPPVEEVEAVWGACLPITAAGFAGAWVLSRGLQPDRIADLDLARELYDWNLPPWARLRQSWTHECYRLVVQAWGASCRVESLHAVLVLPSDTPKSVWPTGYASRGLVFANQPARQMLVGQEPAEEPARVLVTEGVSDWLTACLLWPGLVVFGITAGGWTPEIAARVPDGAAVVAWTDPDAAGDGYAEKIRESFTNRPVRVLRRERM